MTPARDDIRVGFSYKSPVSRTELVKAVQTGTAAFLMRKSRSVSESSVGQGPPAYKKQSVLAEHWETPNATCSSSGTVTLVLSLVLERLLLD